MSHKVGFELTVILLPQLLGTGITGMYLPLCLA